MENEGSLAVLFSDLGIEYFVVGKNHALFREEYCGIIFLRQLDKTVVDAGEELFTLKCVDNLPEIKAWYQDGQEFREMHRIREKSPVFKKGDTIYTFLATRFVDEHFWVVTRFEKDGKTVERAVTVENLRNMIGGIPFVFWRRVGRKIFSFLGIW